jgi:hypothetical protein
MATPLSRGLALVEGEDVRVITAGSVTATGMVFRAYGAFVYDYTPPSPRLALLEWGSHGDADAASDERAEEAGEDEDDEDGEPRLEDVLGHLVSRRHPACGHRNIVVRFDSLPLGLALAQQVEIETDIPNSESMRWPAGVAFILHRFGPDGTPHVLAGFRWYWDDVPGMGEGT